jgi:hypothetical protein
VDFSYASSIKLLWGEAIPLKPDECDGGLRGRKVTPETSAIVTLRMAWNWARQQRLL